MPASMENGAAALRDVPSFVSARAANTIISEDRPTRIQAETLLVLNGLLDELLLLILASARSLATDRIKSDGMLKIFSNNLLAKDAVLEAELELRSYVDGKRAEGAKVPLGLMATSRLDGTDEFPVQSAFKALRLRCQFYSTLADCDDEGLAKDQNIMSTDGRPIATVTQGVAIYVTALLEFVGQHVLQNVSRVIERDNSDEASLYDLRAAITEDEQLKSLYNKMAIKQELARRIDILEARRRKLTEDGARSGVRSDARVVKPWHVPTGGDFDEAAGPTLFSAKRASVQQTSMRSDQTFSTAASSRYGHAASSSLGHADSSSLRASTSTLRTSSSIANHNALESPSLVSSGGGASAQSDSRSSPARNVSGSTPRSEANTGSIGRRQSSDRSWSGMFGSMKRRGSFKQGSDPNGTAGRPSLQPDAASLQASQSSTALDPDDDFEALMLSGQTMKVSLTPNRLHTIEVAKKGDDANLAPVRRRPGTAGLRDESAPASAFGQATSPSAMLSSQMSDAQSGTANGAADRTSIGVVPSETSFPRPSSRASLQTAVRPERRAAAPPPSSYRSPSPALIGKTNLLARDVLEEDAALPAQMSATAPRRSGLRLQPRDDETERGSSNAKDLVDLFRSTPPSATSERFGNFGSDTASLNDGSSRKSAMGDRVRTLFGRKSTSSSGHGTPASPQQKTQRAIARGDTKPSLEGSQDTYVTSSTNNSMEQSRSLFSPNEAPFNRSAASRSSTSTSEHPTASADAAPDSKVTPDVTVVEPETDSPNGTNGLGIGSAAAAAAAAATAGTAGIMAARSASHGSRSTSHASQTPSMTEGTIHDDTIADDASATSKTKATEEPVSRKVPWGYKRNSTNAGSLIERSGTPLSDRRRSIGYQSSNGHGVLPVRGASSAALSDNGHGAGGATVPTTPIASTADEQGAAASASSAARSANAPSAWSGSIAPASSQTRTRRSSFGARPSTANQARRPSAHLETIQLLAELERAMRNCHSVDECRALVQKAMHSDGTPLSPSASGLSAASGGHDANGNRKLEASDSAAGAVAPPADQSNVAPAVTSGDKTGSKEAEHAAEPRQTESGAAITSLEQAEQGLVVAWLLGGDDDPEPRREGKGAERVVRESITSSGSGLTNGEADETVVRNFSLDSTASGKDVANLASSSVVSLQSNYKDAQDEVAAE